MHGGSIHWHFWSHNNPFSGKNRLFATNKKRECLKFPLACLATWSTKRPKKPKKRQTQDIQKKELHETNERPVWTFGIASMYPVHFVEAELAIFCARALGEESPHYFLAA
jgi:hypothetical protein